MTKNFIFAIFSLFLLSSSVYGQKIKIGTYTFKDGAIYSGEIENGKPNGKGKTIFKNGDNYEGEYVKGKRQGYAYTHFQMERNTKDNGFRINSMVKALFSS